MTEDDAKELIRHLVYLDKELESLKNDNARVKARLDEFEERERNGQMEKKRRLDEIRNILAGAPAMANIMLAMNLLMAVDISDDGKKRLYELYVEIQGAMLFMGGVRPDVANWRRELLDIIKRELGEKDPAASLESQKNQIMTQISDSKKLLR